jgi:hypothetical protein
MHTKGPKEDPLIDMGYETRDIDIPTIRKAVIYFFVFATVMFGTGGLIYWKMNPNFDPKIAAQPEDLRIPKSPAPLLQDNVSNFTDIMKLRQHETAMLNSTAYADASHSYLRIPIDNAIDIIAEKGVPKTGASVPAVSKGNTTDEKKFSQPGGAPQSISVSKPAPEPAKN